MERIVGAIALQPPGNRQGGFNFYIILTSRCLNRRSWTELTIPNESIQRIEKMSHMNDHGYNLHTMTELTYLMTTTLIIPAMPLMTMRMTTSIHISIAMEVLKQKSQEWMII